MADEDSDWEIVTKPEPPKLVETPDMSAADALQGVVITRPGCVYMCNSPSDYMRHTYRTCVLKAYANPKRGLTSVERRRSLDEHKLWLDVLYEAADMFSAEFHAKHVNTTCTKGCKRIRFVYTADQVPKEHANVKLSVVIKGSLGDFALLEANETSSMKKLTDRNDLARACIISVASSV